jgi:hypothetical protein
MDRHHTALQGSYLRRILINAGNVMAKVGKAGSRHQAHIACSDHSDAHRKSLRIAIVGPIPQFAADVCSSLPSALAKPRRIVNGQKLTGEMCGADEGARICNCATHAESKVKPNSFAACRRHDFIGVTDRTPADSPQTNCLSI